MKFSLVALTAFVAMVAAIPTAAPSSCVTYCKSQAHPSECTSLAAYGKGPCYAPGGPYYNPGNKSGKSKKSKNNKSGKSKNNKSNKSKNNKSNKSKKSNKGKKSGKSSKSKKSKNEWHNYARGEAAEQWW